MKKFWTIFIIWIAVLSIGLSFMISHAKSYASMKSSLVDRVFKTLLRKTTYSNARWDSSMAAINFEFAATPSDKAEIMKKYSIDNNEYELINYDAQRIRDQRPMAQVIFYTFAALVAVGFFVGLGYFIGWIVVWIKEKSWKQAAIVKFVSIGLTLIIFTRILAASQYEDFKDKQDYGAINDAYGATFGGLIELSNEFYLLDKLEGGNSVKYFTQVSYIRNKAKALSDKLKEQKDIPAVKNGQKVCESIIKWSDIITKTPKDLNQKIVMLGEGTAELKTMYDSLEEICLEGFQKNWGLFSKYYPAIFSQEAKDEYKAISNDEEISLYLVFGFRLYDVVMKNLEDVSYDLQKR